MSNWIMTSTGRAFDPAAPRIEDVCLEDIAHGLAAVNRFGGHARVPYSVAQHSVLVSWKCEEADALYGLFHDAAEAYLGDIPSPLKDTAPFAGYREAEDRVRRVIYLAFDLNPDRPEKAIKVVDRRMLRTEQRDLMPPAAHGEDRGDVAPFELKIDPWSFHRAKLAFLSQFARLTGSPEPGVRALLPTAASLSSPGAKVGNGPKCRMASMRSPASPAPRRDPQKETR